MSVVRRRLPSPTCLQSPMVFRNHAKLQSKYRIRYIVQYFRLSAIKIKFSEALKPCKGNMPEILKWPEWMLLLVPRKNKSWKLRFYILLDFSDKWFYFTRHHFCLWLQKKIFRLKYAQPGFYFLNFCPNCHSCNNLHVVYFDNLCPYNIAK